MRFKPEHGEKTRAAIVAAAGRRFRKDGYHGVGVDAVAADAGMTSGAVYSQFGSKQRLMAAVLREGLEGVRRMVAARVDRGDLAGMPDWYFTQEMRCDPAGGCLLPSLSADVGRVGTDAQAAFADSLPALVDEVMRGMPGIDPAAARERAWTLLALMTGGLALARALPDGPAADEVLAACRSAAHELLAPPTPTKRKRR